jgi:hypothetical protein
MGAKRFEYYKHYNTYDFCSAAEPLKGEFKVLMAKRGVAHRASYKKRSLTKLKCSLTIHYLSF